MSCCDGTCTGACGRKPVIKKGPANPALDKRVAEWTPPNPLQAAIKKALGLPVYVTVRYPVKGGGWVYRQKRIS